MKISDKGFVIADEVLLMHKDVYFPKDIQEVAHKLQEYTQYIHLSKHLLNRINFSKDRSHRYDDSIEKCINSIKHTQREVFEVELSRDKEMFGDTYWHINKYCCKVPYKDEIELSFVVVPVYKEKTNMPNGNALVKTAWLNELGDNHPTLDMSRYCTKENWNILNTKEAM